MNALPETKTQPTLPLIPRTEFLLNFANHLKSENLKGDKFSFLSFFQNENMTIINGPFYEISLLENKSGFGLMVRGFIHAAQMVKPRDGYWMKLIYNLPNPFASRLERIFFDTTYYNLPPNQVKPHHVADAIFDLVVDFNSTVA